MTDWMPVDACTLPTAEQPLRVREFDDLFRDHLVALESEARRAVLTLDGGHDLESLVRDLTARESACCSFFRFEVTSVDGVVWLTVEVPPERQDVLDGLIARVG